MTPAPIERETRLAAGPQEAPVGDKSAGQLAYEEDVRRWPTYSHGEPRIAWSDLGDLARESWEKNPTPRGRMTDAG